MPKPPSKDVKEIQELLSNYSKTEDGILWDMQHRVSKVRTVRKRVHKVEQRAVNRRKHFKEYREHKIKY